VTTLDRVLRLPPALRRRASRAPRRAAPRQGAKNGHVANGHVEARISSPGVVVLLTAPAVDDNRHAGPAPAWMWATCGKSTHSCAAGSALDGTWEYNVTIGLNPRKLLCSLHQPAAAAALCTARPHEFAVKVGCAGRAGCLGPLDDRPEGLAWQPRANVPLTVFEGATACRLLSGGALLLGESIERMLYQALLLILSDDYQLGSLFRDPQLWDIKYEGRRRRGGYAEWAPSNCTNPRRHCCKGQLQFTAERCSNTLRDLRKEPIPRCASDQSGRVPLQYLAASKAKHLLEKWSPDDGLGGRPGYTKAQYVAAIDGLGASSIVLVGYGLHDGLDASIVQRGVIALLRDIDRYAAARPSSIWWITQPAPDLRKKPKEWHNVNSIENTVTFNDRMRKFAALQGMRTFDLWNASLQAFSTDGTHFDLTSNVLFAQLFLNRLHRTL